ncbi:hypothetical protein CEE37_02615 [candidate division LCP-89 bacterium B3_LCP]|uniref:Potassium channel domain-containing protein n=1 Tax=candidate division LCP-89 bacterium B3_LCP TaxID=2012998 RepID=A0A532V2W4_UNCL8|nr:MAG: hypothetical protein CEE37_02615 [candidate division LCP-89 bacterium B3_LCP]
MNKRIILFALVLLCLLPAGAELQARVIDLRDSTTTDTISADKIIEAIKVLQDTSDVLRCDSLIISGKINISGSGIDTVKCIIRFSDSEFSDDFTLQNTGGQVNFSSCVYFERTIFHGNVNFSKGIFHDNAYFDDATFSHGTYFSKATFNCNAYFRGVIFKEGVRFEEAIFSGDVYYNSAVFHDNSVFISTIFSGETRFYIAEFFGDAYFRETTFSGNVDFENTDFYGNVSFEKGFFSGYTNFSGVVFFHEIYSTSTIDLTGAKFLESLNLKTTSFLQNCRILLEDIEVRNIELSWLQLEEHLHFYDRNLGVIPAKRFDDINRLRKVFIHLENNFANLGQFEDQDACYYERMTIERRHANIGDWLLKTLLHYSCGYGVKPGRVIFTSFFVIILFALFYYLHGAIQERKFDDPALKSKKEGVNKDERNRWARFRDALYFSVNTFTTVGYGDWYPTAEKLKIGPGRFKITLPIRFRTLAMCEGLIGWMLLALFLITLGRVWIR